jgi:hypothetical protein
MIGQIRQTSDDKRNLKTGRRGTENETEEASSGVDNTDKDKSRNIRKKKKTNMDGRGRQITQKAKGTRKTVIQDDGSDKLDKASAITIQRSRQSEAKTVLHDIRRQSKNSGGQLKSGVLGNLYKSNIQKGDIKNARFWAERGTTRRKTGTKRMTGTMTDLAKQPGKKTIGPEPESKWVPLRRADTGTDKRKQESQQSINREG